MDGLRRAVDEFDTDAFELPVEAAALERARRSVEVSGLLLLGEVHGVLENPLVIMRLMRVLDLTHLALEWPEYLKPELDAYLAEGAPLDHPVWWMGAGNITAGHFAVLKAMAGVRVTLFDGSTSLETWSARDAGMARRVLEAGGAPALVVAGNLHTPIAPIELGKPMGACLAEERPGVESVRIAYGSGSFYNNESRKSDGASVRAGLGVVDGELTVGLPEFGEATVPHLPEELLRERFGW